MKDDNFFNTFMTDDDSAPWLITFADIMTLLLVFFVLFYTLSSNEHEKYKQTVESIKVQIKGNENLTGLMELMKIRKEPDTLITIEDIIGLKSRDKSLFEDLSRFAASNSQKENLSTQVQEGKIIVNVAGKALFNSGSAFLNPSAVPIFDEIIQILSEYPDYNINIKGHTDNIPITTGIFPSNWELSAVRATTVLKYLIAKGISPKRLTATGYGDVMPLVPNTSEENRTQNRRVEFVLEKKDPRN